MLGKTKKAYIMLADGTVYNGFSFGAEGEMIGEIVFATGMTGYAETLTDPSYFGQIVTQTFPLIGNYGTNPEDYESAKSVVSGYIVREYCENPSNFRSQGRIDDFLKAQGIIGIYGVDTRALTKKIREHGVMNGVITTNPIEDSEKAELLERINAYIIKDAVKTVTTPEKRVYEPDKNENENFSVVLYDYGYKYNIRRELQKRGCTVTVVPGLTPAEEVIAMKPDGIMLSNGPGDPSENVVPIENLKRLKKSGLPVFGICLGHQLMALASGAVTEKLKYGHRGANQPVKDILTGNTFVTSQNHGYAVVNDSLPAGAGAVSHINANDNSCEGIRYTDCNCFTVQFHPEACGGPHDTAFLFDEFIKMIKESKKV
jgi:carbamoyl-phosphate synthase small subunit